ncbi:hypothetical protein AMTR_s00133p00071000 [Amborella trichopoda]|uniref:Uncharacterized protein n=1 Tax=Amborella trichopoda TaxID=13333 RepID=W1P3I5_AMBTC|nr:hypothetical protein AMTR_s00133p00071000 [Amborella trichopoda]
MTRSQDFVATQSMDVHAQLEATTATPWRLKREQKRALFRAERDRTQLELELMQDVDIQQLELFQSQLIEMFANFH